MYEKQDKAFNKCQDACPCYRSCPNGCSSCAHETCSCADADNNPDFLACSVEANENYFACINQCPVNDMLCISACGRSYEHSLERCPCQELCPGKIRLLYKLKRSIFILGGCPCAEYSCGKYNLHDLRHLKRQSVSLTSAIANKIEKLLNPTPSVETSASKIS